MTDSLKNRWIIVGIIWVGALFLTYLNSNKIDLIIRERKADEVLQKDREFWKYNSEHIADIVKKGDAAYQNVESAKLGLLSVEDQLTSLATRNGLTQIKMEGQPGQDDGFGIPVDLFFKGPFDGAMHWLNVFEKNYPYLFTRKLKITMDQPARQAEFFISFYYRYRISFPEDET